MRREVAECGRGCELFTPAPTRQTLFAAALMSQTCAGRRRIRDHSAQSEPRSYQVRNRRATGEYRALIGHKWGAVRPSREAAASEKPGFLGILADQAAAENENARDDIRRMISVTGREKWRSASRCCPTQVRGADGAIGSYSPSATRSGTSR